LPSYRKRFYNVSIRESRYTVNAGTLDGLSQGDELTIYKTQSEDDQKQPVAVFVINKVFNRNSILRVRHQTPWVDLKPFFELVDPAPALFTKSAQPGLRLYISAGIFYHVSELIVSLVNRLQTAGTSIAIITSEAYRPTAHICLSTDDGVNLRFDVVDGDRFHSFQYNGDYADEDLTEILRGLSDYYWHLTRSHPIRSSSIPPDADISISFCKLRQDNENSANPIFVSEGDATELLVRDGSVIELEVNSAAAHDSQTDGFEHDDEFDESDELYGVKVANNSQKRDLYPALFYFDNGDFTICKLPLPALNVERSLTYSIIQTLSINHP
jgi:hypothetical protein